MKLPVYLDAHATTPCDPAVVEALLPCFGADFGNASSSSHAYGWRAEALVEKAREQVAALIGAGPREIIFTSGATESDNLAIKGLAALAPEGRRHLITCAAEHKAVLEPMRRLERAGFRVTALGIGPDGRVALDDVERAITGETFLASFMFANNETGAINPVGEIGRLLKSRGVHFHCDGAQALAHLPCDAPALGIDLLSISGHKMYGPKGVGALWLRRRDPRVMLEPLFEGGGQERGLRPGTLNVPGIVGLGAACAIAARDRATDAARVAGLRDRLLAGLREGYPELILHGGMEYRLPNNLNVAFPGVAADALMTRLSGKVALSSGSACTSETVEPSHVLIALGVAPAIAHSSLRFGLSRFTTGEEIEFAIAEVCAAARELRAESL